VAALIDAPPLAAIPRIETAADRRRRRMRRASVASAAVVILGTAVVLVHYFYLPLDVLWYAAQRRFGLA
jgi:hypothetical protein